MRQLLIIAAAISIIQGQTTKLYDCGSENKSIVFDPSMKFITRTNQKISFPMLGKTTSPFKSNYAIFTVYGDATESNTVLKQQRKEYTGNVYEKGSQFTASGTIYIEGLTSYKVQLDVFDSDDKHVGCAAFVRQEIVTELTNCGTDIKVIEFEDQIVYEEIDANTNLIFELVQGRGLSADQSDAQLKIKVYGGAPEYQTLVKEQFNQIAPSNIFEGSQFNIHIERVSLKGLDIGIYNSIDSDYRIQFEVNNTKKQIIGCGSFFAKTNYFGEKQRE